jgi:hypothetical protein
VRLLLRQIPLRFRLDRMLLLLGELGKDSLGIGFDVLLERQFADPAVGVFGVRDVKVVGAVVLVDEEEIHGLRGSGRTSRRLVVRWRLRSVWASGAGRAMSVVRKSASSLRRRRWKELRTEPRGERGGDGYCI